MLRNLDSTKAEHWESRIFTNKKASHPGKGTRSYNSWYHPNLQSTLKLDYLLDTLTQVYTKLLT